MQFKYKPTPFNIDILVLTRDELKSMTPIGTLSIFEPSSTNFDPEGLFSTEIFGAVGSDARNERFSYVNLRAPVFHPLVYKHLITTKLLYKDIIAGKKYAVYDPKLKDLVLSTEEDGRTGYSFFLEMLGKIKFFDNDSDLRKFKIFMISKYGTADYLLKDLLVLPAGLRDYKINRNGRPEEDEINDKYRKIIALSNSLASVKLTAETLPTVDSVRYRIQEAVLDIYEYIMTLLDGKRKFIQGRFGSRGLLYGTRNVITPSLSRITNLRDPNNLSIEHTTVGLFQYARAITPITMHKLHSVFISKLFSPDSSMGYLVNAKSMKTELVDISIKDRDAWLTLDGLDKMLGTMGQEELREEPILVGDKYLMLLHDDGKVITPIFNSGDMQEGFDTKYLRPITYYEILYIALLDTFDKYRAMVTRYPVINLGGIYPSKTYVKTTSSPRKVMVQIGMSKIEAREYPNYKGSYYNSLSPHYAYLAALGGDHDGDKVSFTIVYTDEAIAEIDALMATKEFYLAPDGNLVFSPMTDTLGYVVASLNKGMIYE